jgi:FkbM family methyltransferase
MLTFLRKVRVALTPREWLLKTVLPGGEIIYGKNRTGFGGRGIYVLRDAIEPEYEHFTRLLPDGAERGGVVVDVGANTGIYSIKAAKHFDNGQSGVVISVEPFPDVLAALYKSVQANNFQNVRLRNFCAGEHTETSLLWMNSGKPHEFSLLKHDKGAKSLSTLVVALDDMFMWEHLDRFDYLKIDAEGAENEVLRGAKGIIAKYRPIIQVEVTISDISTELPNYAVFQASGSPNKVYIPREHSKIGVPSQLGWSER